MARLLIIEDPSVHLRLTVFVLELAGHAVHHAADAESGVRLAHEEQPDLILLDLDLSGTDALQVGASLKRSAATRAIPVVALAAGTKADERTRVLATGCNGYLDKFASPGYVLSTIARHVTSHPPAVLPAALSGGRPQ